MTGPAATPVSFRCMGPTFLFAAIGLSVMAANRLLGAGTTTHHLILLLALLPFFGIPHGALDYHLARVLLQPRLGRYWGMAFVVLYLLAMAVVVVLWHYQATFSLAAFLVLTYYHFSTGDALRTPQTPWALRITEWVSRGGIVLTFAARFDRAEVQGLLSHLAPADGVEALLDALAAMAPFCALAAVVCILASLSIGVRRRAAIDVARGLEIAVLAALFSVLPALLAFALYFSFLHSLRHMLGLVAPLNGQSAVGLWWQMFCISLPVTLATLLMGVAAYGLLGGLSFETSHLMRVIFIGIASMTYPHALIVYWAARADRRSRPMADVPAGHSRRMGWPIQDIR